MAKNNICKDHTFYCLNCGHKGIPLIRQRGHLHSKNHRKALYCPYCKNTVNHIEIRNLEEEIKFRRDFDKGLFQEEAIQSIQYIKTQTLNL